MNFPHMFVRLEVMLVGGGVKGENSINTCVKLHFCVILSFPFEMSRKTSTVKEFSFSDYFFTL